MTLVGRRGETAQIAERLARIRRRGTVDVVACDITDDAAVAALAGRFTGATVDLLVHAAVDYLSATGADAAAAKVAGLETVLRTVPLAADVDLDTLATDLDGYSAADCAALLREAALAAMRRSVDAADVTAADIAVARASVRPSLDPAQVAALAAYRSGGVE